MTYSLMAYGQIDFQLNPDPTLDLLTFILLHKILHNHKPPCYIDHQYFTSSQNS